VGGWKDSMNECESRHGGRKWTESVGWLKRMKDFVRELGTAEGGDVHKWWTKPQLI
jgi:hypothetical protein